MRGLHVLSSCTDNRELAFYFIALSTPRFPHRIFRASVVHVWPTGRHYFNSIRFILFYAAGLKCRSVAWTSIVLRTAYG